MSNYDTKNVNPTELAKFDTTTWWDPNGEFKPLHEINPLRLDFVSKHCNLERQPLIDVGCGGGIFAEGLAKLGAQVTGIDLSDGALQSAKQHAAEVELSVDYQKITVEAMAQTHPEKFAILTCMEMLEHVPNPAGIIRACAKLVKPGGHLFFSTINRNPKAYLQAILGAEYVLKLLPKGTHNYASFIRPAELALWTRQSGLELKEFAGINYNPLTRQYKLTSNVDVNYLVYCQRDE